MRAWRTYVVGHVQGVGARLLDDAWTERIYIEPQTPLDPVEEETGNDAPIDLAYPPAQRKDAIVRSTRVLCGSTREWDAQHQSQKVVTRRQSDPLGGLPTGRGLESKPATSADEYVPAGTPMRLVHRRTRKDGRRDVHRRRTRTSTVASSRTCRPAGPGSGTRAPEPRRGGARGGRLRAAGGTQGGQRRGGSARSDREDHGEFRIVRIHEQSPPPRHVPRLPQRYRLSYRR